MMIHRGMVMEEEWTKLDSDGPLIAVIHSIADSSYNTLLLMNYDLYQPAYCCIYTSTAAYPCHCT